MPDRKKVMEELQNLVNDDWMWRHANFYAMVCENAIALLKEQNNCENCAIAIEDRQPVVRCKDCKYAKPINADYLGCSCLVDGIDSDYVMTVKPDSFCSWGERNE